MCDRLRLTLSSRYHWYLCLLFLGTVSRRWMARVMEWIWSNQRREDSWFFVDWRPLRRKTSQTSWKIRKSWSSQWGMFSSFTLNDPVMIVLIFDVREWRFGTVLNICPDSHHGWSECNFVLGSTLWNWSWRKLPCSLGIFMVCDLNPSSSSSSFTCATTDWYSFDRRWSSSIEEDCICPHWSCVRNSIPTTQSPVQVFLEDQDSVQDNQGNPSDNVKSTIFHTSCSWF